jgi:hypothetical protein
VARQRGRAGRVPDLPGFVWSAISNFVEDLRADFVGPRAFVNIANRVIGLIGRALGAESRPTRRQVFGAVAAELAAQTAGDAATLAARGERVNPFEYPQNLRLGPGVRATVSVVAELTPEEGEQEYFFVVHLPPGASPADVIAAAGESYLELLKEYEVSVSDAVVLQQPVIRKIERG